MATTLKDAAKNAKAAIWLCGDGRYRVSVGGTFGKVLDGSADDYAGAVAALTAYLVAHGLYSEAK